MNDILKNLLLWLIIAVVLISIFNNIEPRNAGVERLTYSEFLRDVQQGNVQTVTIQNNQVLQGTLQNDKNFTSYMPIPDPYLLPELIKKGVNVKGEPPQQESLLMRIFINWFPMLLLIAVWIFFMRQMGGGSGKGALTFGRSRARQFTEDQIKVTLADIAGIDEAKEEVSELVEFLKDPGKFQTLGGKMPRGVLLIGPPGTGKTLLARAVAGEAGVPFYSISGSDFVEMFVGVGASRVRDMFEQAKKQAPCIIFIDEIDAVGRHRGAGVGGGHDEREQTLNQLLVEMDGFEGNEGVIVMAATNRPDVLDAALLRPGRFDRQVFVGLPDIRGREQILRVHLKKILFANNINLVLIARGTPGFSGADLANLVNEAALLAARANKARVELSDLEKAKDKVMMGAERRSMVMSEKEKKLTAYHEAGHAIVGLSLPEHDPVYKVTIIPRGRALGVTVFLPEEDRYSYTKQRLEGQVASLFGGRIAEALIFGIEQITTGASNDLQRATEIVRNMVTKWGLSKRLGPLTYNQDNDTLLLGHPMAAGSKVSDATTLLIDEECRTIIDRIYQLAESILTKNIDKLHLMADALVKYETIDSDQIKQIMQGQIPNPPHDWPLDDNHQETSTQEHKTEDMQKTTDKIQDGSTETGTASAGDTTTRSE